MDYKQREEAARRVADSVREAIGRIRSDWSAGHQIVRGIDAPGDGAGDPKKRRGLWKHGRPGEHHE